jgi:serine/threonine protein kinase
MNNEEKFVDPDLFRDKQLFNTKNPDAWDAEAQPKRTVKEEGDIDSYDWVKVIGQGTFGVVYKAVDLKTKKTVAIKKVYQDPNYRNREFMIVVELDHVNCIKVHNYFFTSDTQPNSQKKATYLNLVMDYVPETLYRVLRYYRKKGMEFPDPLGKIYSYQMFRSLAYIHALGIVHRDIKPQNILIDTGNHRLVMCDFGSAKKIKKGAGEKSVAYICSRYYRAPELILGQDQYGPSIDVWSIGCVIAEMFLGEPIFPGTSSKDQMIKIMELLGTPNQNDVTAMCKSAQVRLPNMQPKEFKKKFKKNTNPEALDLLERILCYNPEERITPLEALMHPYFEELRKQRLTINGKKIVDLFNFNEAELSSNPGLANDLIPKWYKGN